MPDPTRQTVSASQAAALLGVSPYTTRYMLWHHFANGVDIDSDESSRMKWGKILQPHVLAQAAEDLAMEVKPNAGDAYIRRGELGCTRDAEIICPDRGPGALETKCVFDYKVWMTKWNGGKAPPAHMVIQNQVQAWVGDGKTPYEWCVIGAWVCGDMYYFEQPPMTALMDEIVAEAAAFFASVAAGDEPPAFGDEAELPVLAALYPEARDVTAETGDAEIGEAARMYRWAREQAKFFGNVEKQLKPRLLAAAGEAARLRAPGALIKVSKSETKESVVELPAAISRALGEALKSGEVVSDNAAAAMIAAIEWREIKRKASVRQSVDVVEMDDVEAPVFDQSPLAAG